MGNYAKLQLLEDTRHRGLNALTEGHGVIWQRQCGLLRACRGEAEQVEVRDDDPTAWSS
jgi:hypothetical protein